LARASSARTEPSKGTASSRRRRPTTVVLDSSFLIAVMERPTPWSQDITEKVGSFVPVVISSVRDELTRLAGRKKGGFAKLALELLDRGDLTLERDGGGGKPDDEIISFALERGAAVATIDSDLATRLRASRVPVITLRGGRVST
jgi:rRNA-processing protein FCF1